MSLVSLQKAFHCLDLTVVLFENCYYTASGSRRRWDDNIKMHLQGVGCGGMDWIELAQDRDRWRTLVTAVMDLRFP